MVTGIRVEDDLAYLVPGQVALGGFLGGLRISPHFYNTEGEIDKLVSELNAL